MALSANTKNQAASMKFIDFLLEKQNAQDYSTNQALFSTVNGVVQKDDSVANLQSYIQNGDVTDYPDHYYASAMDANVPNMIQGFLVNKQNPSAFLSSLDSSYKSVSTAIISKAKAWGEYPKLSIKERRI